MKKKQTVDEQIWVDVDHAVKCRNNEKENLSDYVQGGKAHDRCKGIGIGMAAANTTNYGALHVSGAGRHPTKKQIAADELNEVQKLLIEVYSRMSEKGKVPWDIYDNIGEYLMKNKLI